MKTTSLRKQTVLDFIRVEDGAQFVFELPAKIYDTEAKIDTFIHGMRVELSRLRSRVRERGKVVRHFKMIKQDVKYDDLRNVFVVTLLKTTSSSNVSNEIDEIFEYVAGGDVIDANAK